MSPPPPGSTCHACIHALQASQRRIMLLSVCAVFWFPAHPPPLPLHLPRHHRNLRHHACMPSAYPRCRSPASAAAPGSKLGSHRRPECRPACINPPPPPQPPTVPITPQPPWQTPRLLTAGTTAARNAPHRGSRAYALHAWSCMQEPELILHGRLRSCHAAPAEETRTRFSNCNKRMLRRTRAPRRCKRPATLMV